MKDIKVISTENTHACVCKFIDETKTIIGDYDDMKELSSINKIERLLWDT